MKTSKEVLPFGDLWLLESEVTWTLGRWGSLLLMFGTLVIMIFCQNTVEPDSEHHTGNHKLKDLNEISYYHKQKPPFF